MLNYFFPKKIKITPKHRGKKGVDWKRYYAIQFSSWLGWWTIKEEDTMEQAEEFVRVKGFFNKPNEIVYIYRK